MNNILNQNELRQHYDAYAQIRANIVKELVSRVEQAISSLDVSPIVRGRTKDFASYYRKIIKILKTGVKHPQIDDVMGIRIICPFIEDLAVVENIIRRDYEIVETERKGHYSFQEFGYESTHLLIKIPKDITAKLGKTDNDIAEIQIRTILQNAWAEVEHEMVYKAEFNPFDTPMRRKLAAVNASLSLADIIFQEIRTYQRQLNGELGKRKESFFQKVKDESDLFLLSKKEAEVPASIFDNVPQTPESIDDLLLLALSAHNHKKFDEAIAQYTRILELIPDKSISSLIYKHRGMAYFAQSKYHDAINDFTQSYKHDKKSYKALYYRGMVRAVVQDYSGALEDFSQSLEINPYQPYCLFRRGQAYYHLGDYLQALSDCDTSLAIEPANEAAVKFKELLQSKLNM